MVNLIDLPDVVLSLIVFKNLSYEDVFRLKLTCKKLKELLDRNQCKNLLIYLKNYPYHNRLFYSNQHVNYSNSLKVFNIETIKNHNFFETFKHIQKLAFYFHHYCPVHDKIKELILDFNEINLFEDLRHLEIDQVANVTGKLSLKNLEVFLINTRYESIFEMDTPRLKAIKFSDGAKPLINYPFKLTYLSIGDFCQHNINDNERKYYLSQLEMIPLSAEIMRREVSYLNFHLLNICPNLTVIEFKRINYLVSILNGINDDIFQFPKLKEMRLQFCRNFREVDQLIDELNKLKKNKKTKHQNIKIFLNNFEMKKADWVKIRNYLNNLFTNSMLPGLRGDLNYLCDPIKMLNENLSQHYPLYPSMHHFKLDEQTELNLEQLANYNWDNVYRLTFSDISVRDDLNEEMLIKLFSIFPNIKTLLVSESLLKQKYIELAFNLLRLQEINCSVDEFEFDDLKFLIKFKNLEKFMFASKRFDFNKEDIILLFENSIKFKFIEFNQTEHHEKENISKIIQVGLYRNEKSKYTLKLKERRVDVSNDEDKDKTIDFDDLNLMIDQSKIYLNRALNECEFTIEQMETNST